MQEAFNRLSSGKVTSVILKEDTNEIGNADVVLCTVQSLNKFTKLTQETPETVIGMLSI